MSVQQDYAEAIQWSRKIEDEGDAVAQFTIGKLYETGEGVEQDYAEAVKWYRKAADQGNAFAQTSLGFMHLSGRGVPQDHVLAHMWFNLAAPKDNAVALRTRDLTSLEMTGAAAGLGVETNDRGNGANRRVGNDWCWSP